MRLALVAAAVFANVAVAQATSRAEFWKGTHAFRGVLNKEGFRSASSFEELTSEPRRAVLIVFGQSDVLNQLCSSGEARSFLRAGGAILLATDQRTGPGIHSTFWLRVSGEPISSSRHFYRPNGSGQKPLWDCPLLLEVAGRGSKRHPIFSGLPTDPKHLTIATNLPSYFSDIGLPLPLANLPGERENRIGRRTVEMPIPFAFGGDYDGGGRYLALADHSLFINDMMLQPDTHNFAFAENIVRWLADGNRRDLALFYEDGVAQPDFNVTIDYADPPVPPQEVLVSVANRFLGNLQREDVLNRTLLQSLNHRTLLRSTIFVFTLGLLLWGLYCFLHARHQRERLPRALAGAATPVDVGHRSDALLSQGNLAEAARELVRQTFSSLGVTTGPPAVEAHGWWIRRVWSKRVSRLWDLAAGGDNRVAAGDLTRLTNDLRALTDAVAGGTLRLDAAAPIR